MSRRERMERRAARRREWAESRRAKADAQWQSVDDLASAIPFGQPILEGHHSEGRARRDRDRIESGIGRAVEHGRMAEHHDARAAGIERQLDRSIFADDDDAADRLRERIAEAEAERDRMKAINVAAKKGELSKLDPPLTEGEKDDIAFVMSWKGKPRMDTTNVSARIRRDRERLAAIEAAETEEVAG